MVPVIELFHSYTLHSCSARYGPHITLPNLRGHIWPWLQTGKLLGNVNSLYMITLVMLVSFANNAVDISVTAMHPTKKLETENCLHWTLNERKKTTCGTFIHYSCDLQISGCRILWFFQFSLTWRNSRTNYSRCAAWALGFYTSLFNMESRVSSVTGKYRH